MIIIKDIYGIIFYQDRSLGPDRIDGPAVIDFSGRIYFSKRKNKSFGIEPNGCYYDYEPLKNPLTVVSQKWIMEKHNE